LRSQGLGVLCGQATVLLLGVGSIQLVRTRDGASQGVQLDDIRAFFTEPSVSHAWFYALLGVLTLYALNTVLCTWDSVMTKWARRVREPAAWAPSVIHVSFLLALVAHLVGGLWNRELDPLLLTPAWTDVGAGRQARLVDVVEERLPNGRAKSVRASVEWKDAAGQVTTRTLGYNEPLSEGWGAELVLLDQAGFVGAQRAVQVRRRVTPGHPWALASALVMAVGLVLMGRRWA
jgi:hypothetical protein